MTQEEKIELWKYNFEQIGNPIVKVVPRTKTRYHLELEDGRKVEYDELSTRRDTVIKTLMKYSIYVTKEALPAYKIQLSKDDLLYMFLKTRDDVEEVEDCYLRPKFRSKTISYRYVAGNKGLIEKEMDIYTYDGIHPEDKITGRYGYYASVGIDAVFGYLLDDYKNFLAKGFILKQFKDEFLINDKIIKDLLSVSEAYRIAKRKEEITIKDYAIEKFSEIAIKELNENYKNKKENK